MNKFKRRVCIFSSFPNGNNTFGNRKNASENREAVLFDHLVRSSNSQRSEIFFPHVFAHWTGFYALSAREKFEGRNEAGSDQIGSIARDRILLLLLREREREKKDRNMDATYFAKRTKLVSTSEVDIEGRGCCCALHASKVYRACIYERLWSLQFERTREPATIKFPSKV